MTVGGQDDLIGGDRRIIRSGLCASSGRHSAIADRLSVSGWLLAAPARLGVR